MSSQQIEVLKVRLEEFMEQKQPFLKQGYSIKDMSNDLDIPAYQLSGFINRNIGVHFNDFLNKSRIKYCENLIKNKKIRISHEVTEDGNYVITAPTEELQKYIIKYSDTPEAYSKDNNASYSKMN